MLETDIRKIDFWGENILKSNLVNLDKDMDCIILLSCNDGKFLDLVYHKVVDSLIDRIHHKTVYKDFSNALENINAFLSWWMNDRGEISWFHALVGIYHKNNFLFSTVWKSSCYFYNSHKDVIEVTDRDDSPKDFNFISNGDVASWESLVASTSRLLDTLSKDDIKDGFIDGWVDRSGKNIERILLHEHTGKNIAVITLQKEEKNKASKASIGEISNYYILKALDNKFSKKLLEYLYVAKNAIINQSQKTRQVFLGLGILVWTGVLYYIVSWFFSISWVVNNTELLKQDLVTAQNHIITASENMNNIDVFSYNIDTAEEIIIDLESKKLFLNDLTKLRDEVWVLQKQFNGISPFESSAQSELHSFAESEDIVKIINISGRIYVVHPKWISWPISQWEEVKKVLFEEFFDNDSFIDATVYNGDIILITSAGKVVNFSRNIYSYIDVKDQATWEKSSIIDSYAENIYLLSDKGNQILRHKRSGGEYDAWVWYLKDDDVNSIWNILSLAVDGGIYILKQDGSMVKLFRSPEYRLESMVLNNLPKNYEFKDIDLQNPPQIKTALNLKYVYMLLKNRVLVFEPNSLRYQDVKSLKYLGQIEWKDLIIEDFYVENDGQIFIAASSGVHKLEFDVVEDKLILK